MSIFLKFTLLNLFLFNLGLLILIFIADYIRNKIYFEATYNDLKNSYDLFLKYIDRYYITSLPYTITANIIYVISTLVIFLIIRYMFIGHIIVLMRVDNSLININYINFSTIVLKYILVLMGIYLYKILLQIIFFKEIVKLQIYLKQYYKYYIIVSFCSFHHLEYICKLIWIFSYRIVTQKFNDDLFEGEYELWKDDMLDYDEYRYYKIYKNIYIKKMIKYLTYLAKNYIVVEYLLWYNIHIFNFLSRHVTYGFFKFMPYMFMLFCLLYDIYNKELFIIYYATFCYFIFYIILTFRKFENNLAFINIRELQDYFYKNDFSYEAQRFYILNENITNINKKSRQNDDILRAFGIGQNFDDSGIIYYVLHNLSCENDFFSNSIKKFKRQMNFLYLRGTITLALLIINIFIVYYLNITITIFNIKISKYFLFSSNLLIILLAMHVYYQIIEDHFTKEQASCEHVYNIHYSIFFWLCVLLQIYFYWIILIKPELYFMATNILVELPYNILKIIKIYSQEDKIMYLFEYFEFYVKLLPKDDNNNLDIDLLRFIIRQLDFESIMDKLTLKDIQVYIKLLVDRYYLDNIVTIPQLKEFISEIMEEIFKREQKTLWIRSFMDPVAKFISAYAFKQFIDLSLKKIGIFAKKGMIIIKEPSSRETAYTIIKNIWAFIKEVIKNKK